MGECRDRPRINDCSGPLSTAVNALCTLIRLTPSSLAIAVGPNPASRSWRMRMTGTDAFPAFAQDCALPFAASIPAR